MMKKFTLTLTFSIITLLSFAQPLSGNYTIDSSLPATAGNYQTFTLLADDLNTYGVSGGVTVEVKEGQYDERFNLTDITGTSTVSKLLIKADPSNTGDVVLKGPGGSATMGTITLAATKYLTFDGINIATYPHTYSRLVYTTGQLADLFFLNCEFSQNGVSNASSYQSGIYAGSSIFLGEGLTFENCSTNGVYTMLYSFGSSSNPTTKITVKNCTWNNLYQSAIYASYVKEVVLHDNVFNYFASNASQYYCRFYNSTGTSGERLDIQRNEFNGGTSGYQYGLYIYYYGESVTNRSIIANNFFLDKALSSSSTRYHIYSYGLGNCDIDNNTFYTRTGSKTSSRQLYVRSGSPSSYTPGSLNLRNNIFVNLNPQNNTSGALIYVIAGATGYFDNISNNLYYSDGQATYPFYFGQNYSTLADFASASGDVNSIEGDPQFIGYNDLHVEGLLIDGQGLALAHVPDDLDGDTRPLAPSTTVDIGADEFTPPSCPKPVNFEFVDVDTTSAIFTWLSANATEFELEYGPKGFARGTGTIYIANSNPDTISGLPKRQIFDIYIRSLCSPGDTSKVQGPLTFNTYNQGKYIDYEPSCGPGFFDISDSVASMNINYGGEVGFALAVPMIYQNEVIERVTIGLNGGILLNTVSGQVSSTINASSPNGSAWFPYNMTLDDEMGGVHYKVLGAAPSRQVIFQWDSVPDFPGSTTADPGTFQVVYEEATSDFYFIYEDVSYSNVDANDGGDAEIGIRGPKQDIDVSINNTDYLSNNSCIRWYYTDCPKPKNLVMAYLTSEEVAYSWTAGYANETEWDVVIGPTGFDPATGSPMTISNTQVIIPSLQERTTYDLYVYAVCGPGLRSEPISATFTTPPHCANPRNINSSTAVDSIMATWLWTASNNNPAYELLNYKMYHGEIGFTPGIDGVETLDDEFTGDTIIDASLMPSGVYEFYVQAECMNNYKSDQIGPFRVVMPHTNNLPCDAVPLAVDNLARHFDNQNADFDSLELQIVPPVTGLRTVDGWGQDDLEYTSWYKFVAPNSGQIRISTTDDNFNGQLAVYETSDCSVVIGMTLIAANDDEVDGLSLSPNFTICGLTPGQEYYMMHDSYSPGVTGQFSIRMYEIEFEAGTGSPKVDICSGETFNLYGMISGHSPGGNWVDLYGSAAIQDDSLFVTSIVNYQEFFFEHRFEDGCAMDSVVVETEVHPPSYAGNNAALSVCKNEPYNLYQALSGLVDHGGVWIDHNGDVMPNGSVLALTLKLPGTYNYQYVVDNGVCPADTIEILVTVDMTCDFMGLNDLASSNYKVYPNPTQSEIFVDAVKTNVDFSLEIMDATGKVVLTDMQTFMGKGKVNVSDLSPGVYLIKILEGNQTIMTRFIKN
jgi:hypothetical protein